jgi:hypothetical protein
MQPSKNLGIDLGTTGGDWLFRQDELVLGPVPASQIVEKLYAGELDGMTQVSRMGAGQFKPLSQVDFFKLHVAKAEAKRRVEEAARAEALKDQRKRRVKVISVVVLGIAVAIPASIFTFRILTQKAPEPESDISVGELVIKFDKARATGEELLAYPGMDKGKKLPDRAGDKAPDRSADKARLASASKPQKPRLSDVSDDPDGMQTGTFDQEAINAVIKANQKKLFPCLTAEAQQKPGLSAKIPIEFVIGNDGRVAKLWIDNPSFKDGPLQQCLLRELQKWKFKPYEGERPTVGLSFKIGRG